MPILARNTFEFFSHSPEQTRRVGMRLGALLQPGQVVLLEGNLGSGKTTLVQGIAQGWGSPNPVSSPTYVIVNDYRRADGKHLYHADAYRLTPGNALDTAILDLDFVLKDGTLVLEWAERVQDGLPNEFLRVVLSWMSEEQRHLVFTPQGKQYETMLKKLQQSLFGA